MTDQARCRRCGKPIRWIYRDIEWFPTAPDGSIGCALSGPIPHPCGGTYTPEDYHAPTSPSPAHTGAPE
jgi:hypothetical protein